MIFAWGVEEGAANKNNEILGFPNWIEFQVQLNLHETDLLFQ